MKLDLKTLIRSPLVSDALGILALGVMLFGSLHVAG